MKKNKVINIGGVNGLGESLVNTNSQSFKALKDAIVSHSSSQSESDVVRNKIISLRFQMESYLSDSETSVLAAKFRYKPFGFTN